MSKFNLHFIVKFKNVASIVRVSKLEGRIRIVQLSNFDNWSDILVPSPGCRVFIYVETLLRYYINFILR